MRFDAVAARLVTLPDPLPPPADALMAVVLEGGPARAVRRTLPAAGTARDAAVLVLLYPDADGDGRVVLIERTDGGGHHSGEISLPGGKAEPLDADPVATALREAAEEIGLDPTNGVTVVGRLDALWIPVSDFRVTPVVALAVSRPRFTRQAAEVAQILEPRVDVFLPTNELEIIERTVGGWPLRYGHYQVEGLSVWGATARILSQLGAVLAS